MAKTKNPVSFEKANLVLAAFERRYRHYLEGEPEVNLPTMIENWEPYYMEGARARGEEIKVPWAIIWESGPFEWAYRFCEGGVDEELAILAEEFLGKQGVVEAVRQGRFTEKPFADAEIGVSISPGTPFIVEIWPA